VLIMSTRTGDPILFSTDGDRFVCLGPGGEINLWDTETGIEKQTYTPTDNTSCTCLAWSSAESTKSISPKKKKTEESKPAHLLAMGMDNGDIILYNISKGSVYSEMTHGHKDIVHGICWDQDSDSLYSCSADKYVICWSISTSKVKSKWKAGTSSVTSVCITSDQSCLITGGTTIKCWDIKSRTIIKEFVGHTTDVFFLRSLTISSSRRVHTTYILSAALNDKTVNVWSLDKEGPEVEPLASFSLQGEPVHLDISEPSTRGQNVLMTVATSQGTLEVFEQQLNGRQRRPVSAKVTVQVGGEDTNGLPVMRRVLGAKLLNDQQQTFVFAHGTYPDLSFENKSLLECDENVMCLVRNNNNIILKDRSKHRTPDRAKVKHVTENHTSPVGKGQKRKDMSEATLEEKLEVLKMVMTSQQSRLKLMEKSSGELLVQGLQSQDTAILDNVLCQEESKVVHQTVSQIPSHAVTHLVEELNKRIRLGGPKTKCYLAWLKETLSYHKTFLSSHPHTERLFAPLQPVFDQRPVLYQTLCRLRGRVDLLMSQMKTQEDDTTESTTLYHDESEDDIFEDEVEQETPSYSNKMWEELSHVSDEDDDEEDEYEENDEDAGSLGSEESEVNDMED